MRSIFSGIETAIRALRAYQRALDVVGHNIANAANEKYSRQVPSIVSSEPYPAPTLTRYIAPGQIGTGVEFKEVIRMRDEFVVGRYREEAQWTKWWEVIKNSLSEIEGIFNEPSETDLNNILNQFWQVWQDLSKTPQSLASRSAVRDVGIKLCSAINSLYERLVKVRVMNNQEIEAQLINVNSIGKRIADLNVKIREVEATGDRANDLRDERDALLSKLNEIIRISYREDEIGQVNVYIGGKIFVQGENFIELKIVPDKENSLFSRIVWSDDNTEAKISGGPVFALIYSRDIVVPKYIGLLNELVRKLVLEINAIHSSGYGLNDESGNPYTGYNFFDTESLISPLTDKSTPFWSCYVYGTEELQEGVTEQTSLYELGITEGTFTISGYTFTLTAADVSAGGMSLKELFQLIEKKTGIKSEYNPVARKIILCRENSKELTAGDSADTSNFLAITGLRTAATGVKGAHTTVISDDIAGRVAVSRYILEDLNKIAASATATGVPGDGDNALKIAQLKQAKTMYGPPPTGTYEEFYRNIIGSLGVDSQEAANKMETHSALKLHLENRIQEVSGVSLDEEAANMIKYQNAYTANARFLNTVNEIIETTINILGR